MVAECMVPSKQCSIGAAMSQPDESSGRLQRLRDALLNVPWDDDNLPGLTTPTENTSAIASSASKTSRDNFHRSNARALLEKAERELEQSHAAGLPILLAVFGFFWRPGTCSAGSVSRSDSLLRAGVCIRGGTGGRVGYGWVQPDWTGGVWHVAGHVRREFVRIGKGYPELKTWDF